MCADTVPIVVPAWLCPHGNVPRLHSAPRHLVPQLDFSLIRREMGRELVVVFDSEDLAPGDRADAVCVAVQEQSVPSAVHLVDQANIKCVMDVSHYGGVQAVRMQMNGFGHARSESMTRRHPGNTFSLAVHYGCGALQDQHDVRRHIAPNELMFMDFAVPFGYTMDRGGSATCLQVPIDEIGLPHEVTRVASQRLAASPLYGMVVRHITDITLHADALAPSSQAPVVGDTTVELTRALLASAYDVVYARGPLAEMLLPRIRSYVTQHLTDPDLSPETIALAHDISQRHLFKLCADADFSLEQWIISARLAGARDDLARPEMRSVPIAKIARRWGFVNNAHFSRRFRTMFGLSPRAWRQFGADADPTAADGLSRSARALRC